MVTCVRQIAHLVNNQDSCWAEKVGGELAQVGQRGGPGRGREHVLGADLCKGLNVLCLEETEVSLLFGVLSIA